MFYGAFNWGFEHWTKQQHQQQQYACYGQAPVLCPRNLRKELRLILQPVVLSCFKLRPRPTQFEQLPHFIMYTRQFVLLFPFISPEPQPLFLADERFGCFWNDVCKKMHRNNFHSVYPFTWLVIPLYFKQEGELLIIFDLVHRKTQNLMFFSCLSVWHVIHETTWAFTPFLPPPSFRIK